MNILFKYPSRGRPDRFFDGLDSIVNNIDQKDKYCISCNLDLDDDTMRGDAFIERVDKYKNIHLSYGYSQSKIDAFNRDIFDAYTINGKFDWDILIGMSDDMRFIVYGFDQLIREGFRINAPDTDMLLHYSDQDARHAVPVLYVAGKKYYERDGYIYHPSYRSLFCDNESMEVAIMRDKYRYMGIQIVNHLNPAYGHLPRDAMFNKQQDDWGRDEANFIERRRHKFFLKPEEIINENP